MENRCVSYYFHVCHYFHSVGVEFCVGWLSRVKSSYLLAFNIFNMIILKEILSLWWQVPTSHWRSSKLTLLCCYIYQGSSPFFSETRANVSARRENDFNWHLSASILFASDADQPVFFLLVSRKIYL